MLLEECAKSGIDPNDVRHYWYKSEFFSIFAKNSSITLEQVRDYLRADLKKYSPKFPPLPRLYSKGEKHLVVIDPADVHIGKLARMIETGGKNYNISIAKRRCVQGVAGLLAKMRGFEIEKFVLVIGNDIIHIDNSRTQSTSSGKNPPMDTDGLWWEMFQHAKDVYIKIIETLLPRADVHVVFNPSNHDFMMGFMLADTLNSYFRRSTQITWDISVAHRKYLVYGKNLICTSHGDGAKLINIPLIIAQEKPKLWGRTEFRYAYLHHIHHKQHIKYLSGKDHIGITLEFMRSPSEPDRWHSTKGFIGAKKAIEAYVHSRKMGQVARITHNF